MTQSLGLERLRVSNRRSSESIPVSIIKYAFCSIHVFSETGKIGLYFLYAVTYLLYIYRECSTLEQLCGSHDLHNIYHDIRTQSMNELLGCEALKEILHYITLHASRCLSAFTTSSPLKDVSRPLLRLISRTC